MLSALSKIVGKALRFRGKRTPRRHIPFAAAVKRHSSPQVKTALRALSTVAELTAVAIIAYEFVEGVEKALLAKSIGAFLGGVIFAIVRGRHIVAGCLATWRALRDPEISGSERRATLVTISLLMSASLHLALAWAWLTRQGAG